MKKGPHGDTLLVPLFKNLPEAALGAIVIGAVWHLIDYRKFTKLWALDRTSFWAALIAMAGVLILGVLEGVLIAVGFSLVALIHRATRPRISVLGKEEERYYDVERRPEAETEPGVLVVRFDYELYFANATFFRDEVRRLVREADPDPYAVVLDCEGIAEVDLTAGEILDELRTDLEDDGITLFLARVKGPVRDMIRRMRREEDVEDAERYESVEEAVDAAKRLKP